MSITVEVRGGNLEKSMRVLKKKVQKALLSKIIEINNISQNHLRLRGEKRKDP